MNRWRRSAESMVRSTAILIVDCCPMVAALSFLLNENVNAGCPLILRIILHPTDSYSCTSTASLATTTVTTFPNEGSGEKGDQVSSLELICSRSTASLFFLASVDSLCCSVVVYERFVNYCIATLYSDVMGLDMVHRAIIKLS